MSGKKREMPKWTKAPEALVALFAGAIEGLPDVEARKMFGHPAAFVNGNMFSCLFQSSMILRLSEPDRRQSGAKPFEPMPGRPMREYVEVPEEVLRSSWMRGCARAMAMLRRCRRSRPGKSGPRLGRRGAAHQRVEADDASRCAELVRPSQPTHC